MIELRCWDWDERLDLGAKCCGRKLDGEKRRMVAGLERERQRDEVNGLLAGRVRSDHRPESF